MLLFGNLFLACLALILLGQLNTINVYKFISLDWLIPLSSILPFAWFFFFIKNDEEHWKKKTDAYFKYAFLVGLLLISISSLKFDFINNIYFLESLISFIVKYSIFLTILSISFGFFTFYFNKEKVEKKIETEKNKEELDEQKRKDDFSEKFPRINKIPFLRNFIKWIYKEGYLCSISLIIVIIIGIIARLWHIERIGVWFDEGLSVLMAQSFLTNNYLTFPSGVFYERAFPYHWYLGFIDIVFNRVFPEIILLRIANLPFFIFNSFLIYFISKKILPKYIAVFLVLIFSISWISISMFREIRFYELSLTIYLLITMVFINYFNYFNFNSLLISFKTRIKSTLGLLFLLILFYFGFLIHPLIVIFLYTLSLFYLIISIQYKKIEYLIISIFSALSIFIGMFFLIKKTFPFINKFDISYLFKLPSPEWASLSQNDSISSVINFLNLNGHCFISLLIVLPIILLFEKNIKKIFIYLSTAVIYLFLSYQGYDKNSIRYYYILVPFLLISFALISFNIFKIEKKIFVIIFTLLIVPYFISGFQEINSSVNFDSKNIMKSFDYNSAFLFIDKNKPYKVFTDNQISVPYYLYFKKKPDKIIYDASVLSVSSTTDQYLGVDYSNFDIFSKQSNYKTYFVMIYMKTQISQQNWQTLNKKAKLIYQDKALLIYELN